MPLSCRHVEFWGEYWSAEAFPSCGKNLCSGGGGNTVGAVCYELSCVLSCELTMLELKPQAEN